MSTSGAGRSAPGGRLLGGAHVAPQGGSRGSRRSHPRASAWNRSSGRRVRRSTHRRVALWQAVQVRVCT